MRGVLGLRVRARTGDLSGREGGVVEVMCGVVCVGICVVVVGFVGRKGGDIMKGS